MPNIFSDFDIKCICQPTLFCHFWKLPGQLNYSCSTLFTSWDWTHSRSYIYVATATNHFSCCAVSCHLFFVNKFHCIITIYKFLLASICDVCRVLIQPLYMYVADHYICICSWSPFPCFNRFQVRWWDDAYKQRVYFILNIPQARQQEQTHLM